MSVVRLVLGLSVAVAMTGLAHGRAEKQGLLGVLLDADREGVVVKEVARDSSADKAGVKRGDVIVKLDGNAAGTREDFTKAIRARKPGESVSLEIARGKETVNVKFKLGERVESK